MTNKKLTIRNKILFGLVGILSFVVLVGSVSATPGGFWEIVAEKVASSLLGQIENETLGGSYTSEPTHLTASDDWMAINSLFEYGDFEVDGTSYFDGAVELDGTLDVAGAVTMGGGFNGLEGYTDLNLTATVTTTLTAAMSGETFYFGGVSSTAFVLPATSTSAGVYYKFVVDSAMSTTSTIQTASLADVIEGALLVAGAVVDCDAEDTITIDAELENLGDFIELRSNGVKWFIGASGTLTASALTCSAS